MKQQEITEWEKKKMKAMQNVYHDFDEREIVTLLNFVVVK